MYAEAFYNKLKTFYLDSRPTKQLDDLINLLFKIEEDDYWRHKREVLYSTNPSIKKTENNRHEKGLVIIDKDMEVINPKRFNVKSQNSDEVYQVTRIIETCAGNCKDRCYEIVCAGLCEHIYTCNCKDTFRLCKHIHKVHSFNIQRNKKFHPEMRIIENQAINGQENKESVADLEREVDLDGETDLDGEADSG